MRGEGAVFASIRDQRERETVYALFKLWELLEKARHVFKDNGMKSINIEFINKHV